MSVHDGHRARKKAQFREHGLDAFADHEALELLLFYAIPRVDTNPVAHRLLERFGSLDGVLSAPAEELQKVEGVGGNAATLLSLILPFVRRSRMTASKKPVILNGTKAAGAYFKDLFFGMREERLYEACLDAKGKLLQCFKAADGSVDAVNINMRVIVENALKCGASAVILAHNHPSGVALPSADDNKTTLMVYDALRTVGVGLVDHIIVADGDFVSLSENGLLPPR
ncbi:MAG: DNA repair protein RadC [Oscillospiraceae bacterium]|nr:DNA repair protein RadC [Oscillospiraceae bacterium]